MKTSQNRQVGIDIKAVKFWQAELMVFTNFHALLLQNEKNYLKCILYGESNPTHKYRWTSQEGGSKDHILNCRRFIELLEGCNISRLTPAALTLLLKKVSRYEN